MMVNLKSLIAGAGLSVMLASGALALTPVSGEVLTPEGAPKSAPTWMEFTPERGDTLYGACTSFLAAAGLADKYGWTDCAGAVVKLPGQGAFMSVQYYKGGELITDPYGLDPRETYFFPVSNQADASQVATAAAPEFNPAQFEAELAMVKEMVEGNLEAFQTAINANTVRIDEQSKRIGEHARSIDELESATAANTKGVSANAAATAEAMTLAEQAIASAKAANNASTAAQADAAEALAAANDASSRVTDLTGRFDGLAGQVTKNAAAAERSNWALVAGGVAFILALLALLVVLLKQRKLPDAVDTRLESIETKTQQATDRVGQFDARLTDVETTVDEVAVVGAAAHAAVTGLGIDWEDSHTTDLSALNVEKTSVWSLQVDGHSVDIEFTKLANGTVAWNVPRKDQPSAMRDPLQKLSKAAVQHKLNRAYQDDCLEQLKQPIASAA